MRRFGFVALSAVLGCGGGDGGNDPPPATAGSVGAWYQKKFPTDPVAASVTETPTQIRIQAGELEIVLTRNPWHMAVLESATGKLLLAEKGRPAFATHIGFSLPLYYGYSFPVGATLPWRRATGLVTWQQIGNTVRFTLATDDPVGTKLKLEFADFRTRQFSLKMATSGGIANRIGMSFQTDALEGFFGFGERYNATNQRGRTLACWSEEGSFSLGSFVSPSNPTRVPGGPTSTYCPVPFFLSSRGHGFEADTPFRTEFDLADSEKDAWKFHAASHKTGAVFYFGTTPAQTLGMYTEMRGRPRIPPRWLFGPWSQMSGQIEGKSALAMAHEYRDRDIPTSCRQGYTHFFPEGSEIGIEAQQQELNAKLHALGLKSTCYFNPYVGVKHPTLFAQGKANQYFVKKPDGSPYVFQYMGFQAAQVDFTNPAAKAWYQAQLWKAVSLGFDGWMYDFGEYTPPDAHFADGRKGLELHNPYPVLYQKAAFEFFQTLDPDPTDPYAPDYVYYVRSGYTGTAGATWAHWTGDPSCDWSVASGMPAQIPAGLSVGLSGIAFSGSDVGGFAWYVQPPPSQELWIRWTQLGCFSGIMRDQTGGLGTGKKTQIFDFPEAVRVWRKYAKLRTALFPYLYTLAHEAWGSGLPIMRHHLLEFPNDPQAVAQKYQYMFGDRMLVAPVTRAGQSTQQVYLPAGAAWMPFTAFYDEGDGRWRIRRTPLLAGGQTATMAAPTDTCPVLIRAGSILPTLDPSVDTLNEATDPKVVSYSQREHLLHLWVVPDSLGVASGLLWDGATMSYAAGTLSLSGIAGKTIVAQIALAVAPSGVAGLPQVASWKDLIGTQAGGTGWAWDDEAKVLWVRFASDSGAVTLVP